MRSRLAMPIRGPKDFWTGAIYLALGAAALVIGRGYPFGTAALMGAGYFPVVISGLLIAIGLLAIGRSFLRAGEAVGAIAWKPALLIVLATILFGVLLQPAGFVLALVVLVLVSASASADFRLEWRPLAGLLALVVFCALVFVKGLGVPMPLVGSWLQAVLPSWLVG